MVLECPDSISLETLADHAIAHIKRHFIDGSDPGLCICPEGHPAMPNLEAFGRACVERVVSQKDALKLQKEFILRDMEVLMTALLVPLRRWG